MIDATDPRFEAARERAALLARGAAFIHCPELVEYAAMQDCLANLSDADDFRELVRRHRLARGWNPPGLAQLWLERRVALELGTANEFFMVEKLPHRHIRVTMIMNCDAERQAARGDEAHKRIMKWAIGVASGMFDKSALANFARALDALGPDVDEELN